MKKSDIILIISLLIISLIGIIFINTSSKDSKTAYVYYDNQEILKIPLNIKKTYTVKGYLDDVVIETDIGKIRVKQETSPRHLCQKWGWISNEYTPIICLPNKIVIKIKTNESKIDTVVS